ncbi:MAG: DUF881 domain-containing protein [Bacillota bacterium]
MANKRRWQIYISILCMITGMLIAWQYSLAVLASEGANKGRNAMLVSVIEELEAETLVLEEKILELRKQLDALHDAQLEDEEEITSLQKELQWMRSIAALTEVYGPGITVTLDDNVAGSNAAKNQPDYNPNNYIIHDKNILYLVNEIKRAGAEAIAVNNQRIVSTSDIRCVGPVIFVNSTRMAPPYIIQAIGDPDRLERVVSMGEEYTYLKYKDFPVKLVRETVISLPAYKGGYSLNNAQKAPEGGS